MIKFINILILSTLSLFLFVCCSNYSKVKKQAYHQNNPHAKDLLLHGFSSKISDYIDNETLNLALLGNEEAKQIIYAQMEFLRVLPSSNTRIVPTPVIINHSSTR